MKKQENIRLYLMHKNVSNSVDNDTIYNFTLICNFVFIFLFLVLMFASGLDFLLRIYFIYTFKKDGATSSSSQPLFNSRALSPVIIKPSGHHLNRNRAAGDSLSLLGLKLKVCVCVASLWNRAVTNSKMPFKFCSWRRNKNISVVTDDVLRDDEEISSHL